MTLPDELTQEAFELGEGFTPPPGAKVEDSEAPYGFTASGAVRGRPGRKPAAGTKPPAKKAIPAPRRAIPGPGQKKSPVTPPSKKTQVDYGPALTELLSQVIGPMAVIGLMRSEPALIADAATVSNATPSIVQIANAGAEQFPFVAAILDKVCKVGPYAGALGGITLMVGQIAVNHGVIPAGLIPGTLAPAALAEKFIREQAEADENFALLLQQIAAKNAKPAAA